VFGSILWAVIKGEHEKIRQQNNEKLIFPILLQYKTRRQTPTTHISTFEPLYNFSQVQVITP
jgi:hypothetical protein